MKALYIFEFSRDDCDNESEWFVGDASWSYDRQELGCYEHLQNTVFSGDGLSISDIKEYCQVVAVYPVDNRLIREIYESFGDD